MELQYAGRAVRTIGMLLLMCMAFGATAAAHAFLDGSSPEENSVVAQQPASVHLKFSEPVEVGLSVFKVYPLEPDEDALRLQAQAAKVVGEVLLLQGDAERRADVGLADAARRTDRIEILLRDDLKPGPYVVMWRVLSIDTHTTAGHFVFVLAED